MRSYDAVWILDKTLSGLKGSSDLHFDGTSFKPSRVPEVHCQSYLEAVQGT